MRQVGRSQDVSLRRCRTRGIALVAVLWGVSLLAAIAASFATTVRSETVVARNQIQNAEARALADAGFYRTVMALALDRAGMNFSGLPETRSLLEGPRSRQWAAPQLVASHLITACVRRRV